MTVREKEDAAEMNAEVATASCLNHVFVFATVQELKCGGMRKLPVTCGSVVLNRCCGQYCRGHVLKAFLS